MINPGLPSTVPKEVGDFALNSEFLRGLIEPRIGANAEWHFEQVAEILVSGLLINRHVRQGPTGGRRKTRQVRL